MSNENKAGLIIVFGAEKGGSGKSTGATNCAAEFARRGYKVLLVDADRQRTAAKWAERRDENIEQNPDDNLPVVHCIEKLGNLKNTLTEMATNYDVVIVDPAGRDSSELRSALLAADRLYIPTQASQFDLETLDDVVDLYGEVLDFNPNLQGYTLLTQAPTNFGANELAEAKQYLGDFADIIPLCKTVIKTRKAYRMAPRTGNSVVEGTDSAAKAEIQLLVQEMITHAIE